jgi:ssDNA-binding Zn-finger/Zn-ribbon topoisomerase 1
MPTSPISRFFQWIRGRLGRSDIPEFRTKEDYFRWKATQQPQPKEPEVEAAVGSAPNRPAKKKAVHQGPAVCPYCGESFASFPKRKRKCPSCENAVVIWRGRRRKERVLVTEARAAALASEEEEERIRVAAQLAAEEPERRIRRIASDLAGIGISEDQVRHQLSVSVSEGDARWALFTLALNQLMKEGDFDTLAIVYFRQAHQLDQEGRDFQDLLAASRRMRLLAIQKSGTCSRVSIAWGGGCQACEDLNGTEFSLEDAIRLQPLPCKECSHTLKLKSSRPGWCRCDYSPIFD